MERTPSQGVPCKVLGHSDVALQNKSPPNLIYYLLSPYIQKNHKNKSPSFHRPIPPQMERTPSQGVPCKVPGHSDVVLENKSPPNLIYFLFCSYIQKIIKIKVLASTDQFHLIWRGHLLKMSPAKFQDILMLFYKIKAPQNSYYLFCPYIQKIITIKVLASTDQFHLRWRGQLLKVSPAKFQDILMLFSKIKAPQNSYITYFLHSFRKS